MRTFKLTISRLAAVAAFFATIFSVGCTDDKFEVGTNFLPDGQKMVSGSLDFKGAIDSEGERVLSTRLFRSKEFNMTNQTNGYIGARRSTEFGDRYNGFFTQFTPGYTLDEEGFGSTSIVDSVLLFFSVADYAGDTTHIIRYGVYEVMDDSFLTQSADSVFTADDAAEIFDTSGANGVLSERLFTFDYPNQDKEFFVANTTYVKLTDESPNGDGGDLLARLMLKKVEGYDQIDYEIYNNDDYEEWLEHFKGLYVYPLPMEEQPFISENMVGGATYGMTISSSGFGFYGRTIYEDDPQYVQDTIGMTYLFTDAYKPDYGGMSVAAIDYDYSSAERDLESVIENKELVNTVRVEGMGGIGTEFVFEKRLFEEFEAVIDAHNAELSSDKVARYTDMSFNVARLLIYIPAATEYNVYTPNSVWDVDALYRMPNRLGLYKKYTNFSDEDGYTEMETVNDYSYYYEYNYSAISDYGGLINANKGCYVLNIPLFLSDMWTEYVEAKEEAGGVITDEMWESYDWNRAYLGAIMDDLFMPDYSLLQGGDDGEGTNRVPMRLTINYTLVTK